MESKVYTVDMSTSKTKQLRRKLAKSQEINQRLKILCFLMAAVLITLTVSFMNQQKQISTLQENYSDIKEEYSEVIESYSKLSIEYAEVLAAKKQAYAEYRLVKNDAQELLIAQQNVASLYDAERKEEDQKRWKDEQSH